jgi:hypothetical protein
MGRIFLPVTLILVIFILNGCGSGISTVAESGADSQALEALSRDLPLPDKEAYRPSIQAKAGGALYCNLRTGWNQFSFPLSGTKKFSTVSLSRNEDTLLLPDAVTPGWTSGTIRQLKGRAWKLLASKNGNNLFKFKDQYYLWSSANKTTLNFNKPHITGVTPTRVPEEDDITIQGVNFGTTGSVTVSGLPAGITSWSDTSITCTVPLGATTGPVKVFGNAQQSNAFPITIACPVQADFYVSPSGSDSDPGTSWKKPLKTLTRAMNLAMAGKTIVLMEGTYSASSGETLPIILKSGVILRGGYYNRFLDRDVPNHPSVLDGEQAHRLVSSYASSPATVIEGLTLTRGAYVSGGKGGGMYCYGGSTPAINDCTFSNNSGGNFGGGGLYCSESSPSITGCLFTGNTTQEGGAIYCFDASPVITNCTFTGNSATGFNAASGGAIYFYYGTPQIRQCTFSGNYATGGGGGIHLRDTYVNTTVRDSIFTGNNILQGGGYGGAAICFLSGQASLINCLVSGNTSNDTVTYGGGFGGGISYYNSTTTTANCTITGNSAYFAGGIYFGNGTHVLNNTIIWGNTLAPGGWGRQILNGGSSGTKTFNYCAYSNGPDDIRNYGGVMTFNSSCLTSDPLFVGGADYRLQTGSPCVDTASNGLVPAGITTDLDGNPRIVNSIVDMGAYEKQ